MGRNTSAVRREQSANLVIPWETFLRNFRWEQDEHITLIGPTGCGKTTLAIALLAERKWAVAFGTKPRDKTLEGLIRNQSWRKIPTIHKRPGFIPGPRGEIKPVKLVLWPKFEKITDVDKHGPVFTEALAELFLEGNWTIFADEIGYLSKIPEVRESLITVWTKGRALGLSLVTAMQRPAWVPLESYSSATHLFFWQSSDAVDVKRLKQIGGPGEKAGLVDTIMGLNYPAHEVLYVNAKTGQRLITIPPK